MPAVENKRSTSVLVGGGVKYFLAKETSPFSMSLLLECSYSFQYCKGEETITGSDKYLLITAGTSVSANASDNLFRSFFWIILFIIAERLVFSLDSTSTIGAAVSVSVSQFQFGFLSSTHGELL